MDMHHDRPPAYTQLRPDSLVLPSVPAHAPGAQQQQNDRLPGIKALDLPDASPAPSSQTLYSRSSVELSPRTQIGNSQWSPLPPLSGNAVTGRRQDAGPRESDLGSPMDTGSVVSAQSDYADRREISLLSVDDLQAAEALSGLGNPDFARSRSRSITMPRSPPVATEPEPLLSLITSNHPWLGGTINGSISAYHITKSYTPGFVQRGAELIERSIGSPVVNTVSSVGRRTGVEKNLRKYLGEHRRPSDLEQADSESAHKRPRVMSPAEDAMDFEQAPRTGISSRSSFAESLPAYDDHRSPNYEESVAAAVNPATDKETASQYQEQNQSQDRTTQQQQQHHLSQDRRVNWPTQLIMTTSGLGVALSDRSLQSLKTCLGYLRGATSHIDSVMHALKLLLEEYESAVRNQQEERQQNIDDESTADPESGVHDTIIGMHPMPIGMHPTPFDATSDHTARDDRVRQIADRMKSASTDIWHTLENVTRRVSRYTGGALPQNASQVVQLQLLSVPQRWQSASSAAAGEDSVRGAEARGAQRMLAFAREGLDMMGQITRVVDGTVTNAESWLARIGRRPGGAGGEASASASASTNANVNGGANGQGNGYNNGNINGNVNGSGEGGLRGGWGEEKHEFVVAVQEKVEKN